MTSRRVLVVDDDEAIREIAAVSMRAVGGHDVQTAASGAEALLLAAAQPPEVILLDVMMPGLNGLDVLKTIRAHPVHKDLPVVVFSALSDEETRDAALANGAQEYLVKSKADFDTIRACIESHLPV